MLRRTSFWVTLALLAASAVGLFGALHASEVYLRKGPLTPPRPLREVPAESASWRREGQDVLEAADVVKTLGTENYLTRLVVRKTPWQGKDVAINFHAAYYTGSIDTVPHVPDRCFVGGGMQKGSDSRGYPLKLDLSSRSMFRSEQADPFLRGTTPEAYQPVVRADGSRDVYWIRLSNEYSAMKGATVRVPFDPKDLTLRVSSFKGRGERPLYAGYLFIANGGVTDNANQVRQLAFKLEDQYAYYIKLQFTSGTVDSAEELAAIAADFLNENLGEILACTPDWVRVRMLQDQGLDPNGPQADDPTQPVTPPGR